MTLKSRATRRAFLQNALLASAPLVAGAEPTPSAAESPQPANDRATWLGIVERVA
jgi:hypothetical protein